QPDLTPGGFIGAVLDARHLEHAAAGDAGVAVVVLIRKIDQLLDAALDDRLGALIAGEQRHIHPRAGQVVVRAVEDRVQFRVADIHILGFQVLALALPGHVVVVATDGHAVVPQRQDLVLRADDAGAHLAVVVLGAHGGKQGDAHKIFIPTDIIRSFHSVPLPSYSFYLYYTVRNAHSQGCLCKYLRRVASPPRRWRSA